MPDVSETPVLPVIVHLSVAACPPFPALLHGGDVLALTHWPAFSRAGRSLQGLMAEWQAVAQPLEALCRDPGTAADIERLGTPQACFRLHAPVAPRQVYCTIGNYTCQWLEAALDADDGPHGAGAATRREAAQHAIAARRRDGLPYIGMKGVGSLAGPHDALPIAPSHATLDWEVEIGVVIGRRASNVTAADAWSHVAGCCVVNDLTLRERIFRTDVTALGSDWLRAKSHPGWLPAGPWLVPTWNLGDPQDLRLQLRLNGALMQDGHARNMVFPIAQQIAYLSAHTTLEPGDLVCTGSPAGFGSHHRRFLRPGDLLEARVDGLGAQHVRCIEAS